MTEAFSRADGRLPTYHANLWECREIVRTFLDLGFDVDVINFRNFLFTPKRPYDFLVDTRNNMQRLTSVLGDDCKKIHHIETSHMLFQNAAEFSRLLDLQQRRGIALQPRRVERRSNQIIEHADLAVLYGGEHSARTWAYAGKPLYQVPGTPVREFPSPATKDFDQIRKNFLWIGSGGLVLKGLDLTLEAFASMPDHHLTVCGPLDDEPDFKQAFHRELYETPNITTLGWVDLHTPSFEEVLRRTVGMVYPSASESLSGVTINGLHAGLIPIVTAECGVLFGPDIGTILPTASVGSIRRAVQEVSGQSTSRLEEMAASAWHFARATHTRQRFSVAYRAIIEGLTGDADMPAAYRLGPTAPRRPEQYGRGGPHQEPDGATHVRPPLSWRRLSADEPEDPWIGADGLSRSS